MVLVALLAVGLTGLVWRGVRQRTGLSLLDAGTTACAVADRAPALDVLMRAVTLPASTVPVVMLAVLAAWWLRRRTRAWVWSLVIVAAAVAQAVLSMGLKVLTSRPRPDAALVLGMPARTFGFPSGHTLARARFAAASRSRCSWSAPVA